MPTLRPYQQQLEDEIDAAWAGGARTVMAISPTGSGKCLGRGTPVMLYDGTVAPVETIKVGDRLMGPDSKPRRVVSVTSGREQMYRVTPVKGDAYEVNESHILSLKMTGVGRIVNLTVPEYLAASATFKHCAKGWRTGVDFEPQPRPFIPAYHFGVWLGDGDSKGFAITTGDWEVVREFQSFASRIGHACKVDVNSAGSIRLSFPKEVGVNSFGRGGGPLGNALRALDVVNNKHIPRAYYATSRDDRLDLLAGILDSDGHYSHGSYELSFKSERLMDDAIRLARSLGFAAYKAPVRKQCTNNGAWGDYFRCSINGNLEHIPCRVERQKAAPRLQKKNVLVTGIRVEPIGEGDYFGFELSGPDRLFLLGDFTVTHNTVLFTNVLARERGASAAIAHRRELVTQMSLALARNGVRHRVIGPKSVGRDAASIHLDELGRSYIDPNARCGVVGIDSLPGLNERDPWLAQVQTWVGDEGHHFLRENKWGRGIAMFPNARGLLVTATGFRSDGNGLGRGILLDSGKWSNDGLADALVEGPTMRQLIEMGYLTDYRVVAPPLPSDLSFDDVPVTASGDLSPVRNRAAMHRSTQIVGDVVKHYLKFAAGKRGVTFAVDVEAATELAAAFRAAGVPAEVVSAKTPDMLRQRIFQKFRRGEVLQLVNVDLVGEGLDIPAIEVVSMVRKTESKGLFDQQFGRALRLMVDKQYSDRWDTYTDEQRRAIIAASSKPKALIIDHVGNVQRHRPPDAVRFHTLDRRERRSKPKAGDEIPLTQCLNPECLAPYERCYPACPYCGAKPMPGNRTAPEYVDGDLTELDPEALAALRGEVARIDGAPRIPAGLEGPAAQAVKNRHFERQHAQKQLREAMALWSGWMRDKGRTDAEVYRTFYLSYGIDIMSAQALGRGDAQALYERLQALFVQEGIVSAERPFERLELDDHDITGERQGKLVAVELTEKRKGSMGAFKWRWRCDCGAEVLRCPSSVRASGGGASCGCGVFVDIAGERVGSLTAVRRLDERTGVNYLWLWACDCGNEVKRSIPNVRRRESPSCGCTLETVKPGDKYGKLTAVAKTDERQSGGGSFLWRWACDCGSEVRRIPSSVVSSGDSASCGCGLRTDFTGERVGKLTAVCPTGGKSGGVTVWVWRCDCGKEVERTVGNVRHSGTSADCGCGKEAGIKEEDFGNLVALEPSEEKYKGRQIMWRFRCTCGREVSKVPSHVRAVLRKGRTPSCGKCPK